MNTPQLRERLQRVAELAATLGIALGRLIDELNEDQQASSLPAFSERTLRLAAHLGCSLRDLCAKVGISQAMFFGYRTGKHSVSVKAWQKLIEAETNAGIRPSADDLRKMAAELGSVGFQKLLPAIEDLRLEPSSDRPPVPPTDFCARVDRLMVALRLNATETRNLIGISKSGFFGYKSGKSPISAKAWRKLIRAEAAAGLPLDPADARVLAAMTAAEAAKAEASTATSTN